MPETLAKTFPASANATPHASVPDNETNRTNVLLRCVKARLVRTRALPTKVLPLDSHARAARLRALAHLINRPKAALDAGRSSRARGWLRRRASGEAIRQVALRERRTLVTPRRARLVAPGGLERQRTSIALAMSFSGFHRRFSRLVDRLLEPGAVVPFLGAGISNGCKPPRLPKFEATVSMMERRMRGRLKTVRRMANDGDWGHLRGVLGLDDRGRARERRKAGFSQLSEVLSWVAGRRTVIETCQVRTLADLAPSTAHTCIAYLAREGLIMRVLTTNWDCCLERAYAGTFPSGTKADWERMEDPPGCYEQERKAQGKQCHKECQAEQATGSGVRRPPPPLAVIATDGDYRASGGRLRASLDHLEAPVLRIVKINGCAGRLLAASPPCRVGGCDRLERAEREIRLTDLDLQRFWNQPWAEDLLLDIARTRTLLFSGFGADEPQVRHTVLTLIAEFRRKEYTPNNAPFLHAYEPTIGFNQAQTLYTLLTNGDGLWSQRPAEYELRSSANSYWRDHAFTGLDAPFLKGPSGKPGDRLDADVFWQRVFQAAYGRLLRGILRPATPLFAWLRSTGAADDAPPISGDLLGECLEWLYPSSRPSGSEKPDEQSQVDRQAMFESLFGRCHWLLEPAPREDLSRTTVVPRPLLLSVWLAALRGDLTEEDAGALGEDAAKANGATLSEYVGAHPYWPLRDHALQIGLFFLTLFLLTRSAQLRDARSIVVPTRYGLRVQIAENNPFVYLVDDTWQPPSLEDSQKVRNEKRQPFLLQIRVPSLGFNPVENRAGSLREGTYRAGRAFAIGLNRALPALTDSNATGRETGKPLLEALAASTTRRRTVAHLKRLKES